MMNAPRPGLRVVRSQDHQDQPCITHSYILTMLRSSQLRRVSTNYVRGLYRGFATEGMGGDVGCQI